MIKDFNGWNKEKITIENKQKQNIFPKERDIWFSKLGVNLGFETNGKGEFSRPVLVMKKIRFLVLVFL